MADSVTVKKLCHSGSTVVLYLMGLSDGTGESAVVKGDKSELSMMGQCPAVDTGHMAIRSVKWFQSGYTYISLLWDHTTDDLAVMLGPGQGELDFSVAGGLHDPQSTGGTGDLLLTTVGHTAGDTYAIILTLDLYK